MSLREPEGDGPQGPGNRLLAVLGVVAVLAVAAVVVVILTRSSSPGPPGRATATQGTGTVATAPSTVGATGATATSTATRAGTTAATGAAAGTAAGTGTAATSTAGVAPTPAGGPVPAGFAPASFTAISDSTWWVMGTAPCASRPCTSIVRTVDGGRSWAGIPAPRTADVDELRFANAEDSYAYGQQLWSTHNGGATWARVPVDAEVEDLAASGGYVYAVGRDGLLRSPVSSDRWRMIHRGDFQSVWVQGDDVLAYADGDSQGVLVSSVDAGARFAAHPAPSPLPCDFATTGGGVTWAKCATGMLSDVLRSTDAGVHWTSVSPEADGEVGGGEPNSAPFAAASGEAAVYGQHPLYRTSNGGRTWTQVPGFGVTDSSITYLGFTDPTHGVAIVGSQGPNPGTPRLEVTDNAGASYARVTFSSG